MIVHLTPDQKALVRDAIASGRLHGEEDAIRQALALWERRERARAEMLASVDVAEAALARGEGRVITQESVWDLAAEVKQRGVPLNYLASDLGADAATLEKIGSSCKSHAAAVLIDDRAGATPPYNAGCRSSVRWGCWS